MPFDIEPSSTDNGFPKITQSSPVCGFVLAQSKTVTSLGSYAMTAITAVTSQNTSGVF